MTLKKREDVLLHSSCVSCQVSIKVFQYKTFLAYIDLITCIYAPIGQQSSSEESGEEEAKDEGADIQGKHQVQQLYFSNKHRKNCERLSSVTINCQVTKIVMNSGYQLAEL